MSDKLLEVDDVSIMFGGVHALEGVSLSLRPGERIAVIGPNGAGKTTLVNCIAGTLSPTSGEIRRCGVSTARKSAVERARQGMGRTFQNLEMFASMSVLDNVLAAIDGEKSLLAGWLTIKGRRQARQRAYESLEMFGIQEYADSTAGSLPYGIRKLVELSRVFVRRPDLLLLDEPVAGLSDTESFLDALDGALTEIGSAVLLIEHDMSTVRRLCPEVCVFDSGRVIAQGSFAEVSRDRRVIEAYLGLGRANGAAPAAPTPTRHGG